MLALCFDYHLIYAHSPQLSVAHQTRHANSMGDIPDFPIEPELALELLMASDFLEC